MQREAADPSAVPQLPTAWTPRTSRMCTLAVDWYSTDTQKLPEGVSTGAKLKCCSLPLMLPLPAPAPLSSRAGSMQLIGGEEPRWASAAALLLACCWMR